MPRGPEITDEVRRFIVETINEDPLRTVKEVTDLVQVRLQQVDHQIRPGWPGESIVQRILREMRQERLGKEPLGLDNSWSVGRLTEHDIPFKAVPKILTIQELRVGHEPLTIREARWIGYLLSVFDDIMELAVWATLYANREKVCELANVPKDTSDIDLIVRSKFVTILGYFPWLFRKDWIPDSYKKEVAETQSYKYEKYWDLSLSRPDYTLKGWLVYAHSLQWMVLWDKDKQKLPKELLELSVVNLRQIANQEGRVLKGGTEKKYIDIYEIITTGEIHEKSFINLEEIVDLSSRSELKGLIEKIALKKQSKN